MGRGVGEETFLRPNFHARHAGKTCFRSKIRRAASRTENKLHLLCNNCEFRSYSEMEKLLTDSRKLIVKARLWSVECKNTVRILRELADDILNHHFNVNVARIAGRSLVDHKGFKKS